MANPIRSVDKLIVTKATPAAGAAGIMVDTAVPTFGFRDITGVLVVKGAGAADPSWSAFQGVIFAYEFSATVIKEMWINFHVPHDYVPGTDIFFHTHWSNAAASPNTGNVVWGFDYMSARGFNQEAFPAATTITVTQACPATRYQHNIAETAAVTIANLEIDSLILTRVYRDATNGADTCTDAVHLLTADIHYQSSNLATKAKAGPGFYT